MGKLGNQGLFRFKISLLRLHCLPRIRSSNLGRRLQQSGLRSSRDRSLGSTNIHRIVILKFLTLLIHSRTQSGILATFRSEPVPAKKPHVQTVALIYSVYCVCICFVARFPTRNFGVKNRPSIHDEGCRLTVGSEDFHGAKEYVYFTAKRVSRTCGGLAAAMLANCVPTLYTM